MRSMLPWPVLFASRRAITAVLALWLCVLATGVWAPVARAQLAAQGVERLCSGEMAPQWAPSPVSHAAHGDALGTALHHQIDCPLCMPVLAPPPSVQVAGVHSLPTQAPVFQAQVQPASLAFHWPPARGPPL